MEDKEIIIMLRNSLEKIASWKEGALAYDLEEENTPREFCESVDHIENYANMRLSIIFDK